MRNTFMQRTKKSYLMYLIEKNLQKLIYRLKKN